MAHCLEKTDSNTESIHNTGEFSLKNLAGTDLSGKNLAGMDLSNANLTNANLKRADLLKAKLDGAILSGADLTRANLSGASLKGTNLDNIRGQKAGFGMADLSGASLFNAKLDFSTFTKASLKNANVQCARLQGARLRQADLTNTDFTEANLVSSDLSLSNVKGARFDNADLRGSKLRLLKGFKSARWIGADIRDINFAGAYLLKRFIIDQNYIEEFKRQNLFTRLIYYIWLITSNCGRSMSRWCFWTLFQILCFATLYSLVGLDYGPHPSPISNIYFSVVTLTTLGFGDVIPSTWQGQLIVIFEVLTGYIMLGGLLSIFTNKMARRGE